MTAAAITRSIQELIAEKLGSAPDSVVVHERFRRLGVDSMMATSMLATLGAQLGRALSPTLAWEYPTPDALARHLAGEDAPAATEASPAAIPSTHDEPVAIVGLACRFPSAPDPEAYWRLLRDGVDAIREPPADRWSLDELFDADLGAPGKVATRWGGFLDDLTTFDAAFFGISPREARQMDPQQRLMLELSWEALEDSGIAPASLKDTRTGVFFGAMWMDYARLAEATVDRIVQHTATGQDLSIIPARVSYTLGLLGPSMAVNTACSSSLVAVHLARQSLLRGESRVALAGGVNLMVAPVSTITMSKFGAMAPDGRSKAFDSRANGYVRGEGGGVVVLKRLSDAIADGDRVYCVLRGSAVNNDGFSNGLTAPSPKAQEAVIRDACADARLAPNEVQYVEAHGTGTMLGDPIEAGALGATLGKGRPADAPLRIGSVKTNIGHLEAAAGIAGLIKVVLSMQHGQLPATLHYLKPNPHIPFEALRVRVQSKLEPWEGQNGKRVAGVSSFGFGGTNAHVLLESSVASATAPIQATAATTKPAVAATVGATGARGPVTAATVSPSARKKVVAVFGGQGSQWLGMGRASLRRDTAARASLEQCDRAMRGLVGWSLLDRLQNDDATAFEGTDFVQPAIFAIQVALSHALQARGLTIDAVIGQSMGEVAAAHIAGALSLEDAARVICTRSALVGRARGGRMAVVPASLEATTEAIAPYGDRLSVAVSAGPESTVVSGDEEAILALTVALAPRGLLVRNVRVDYASHSRFMDPLLPELVSALTPIRPRAGAIEFWSTVTGGPLDGATLGAEYWGRNLRDPVLFAPTVLRLLGEHEAAFVEVDPHPVLETFVAQCIEHSGRPGVVVPCAARDEPEGATLLEAVGHLSEAGIAIAAEPPRPVRSADLLVLSAKTPEALRASAARLREHVEAHPDETLGDLAHTMLAARSPMEHAVALAVPNREALLDALREAAERKGEDDATTVRADDTRAAAPKVVFVFPGQGSQWVGMGRQLLAEEAVFRDVLTECDRAISREAGWSVIDEIQASPSASRLEDIDVLQPVLFAFEVALAALWRSWGIEPYALVGHSMGEVAAACVAGAISIEDGATIMVRRSALLTRLRGRGEMAVVGLSVDEATREIVGVEDRVGVAVSNSRKSTVLSGEPAALAEVLGRLEARGVFARRIKVDVAGHSPQMDPLLDELAVSLAKVTPRAASIPLRSTVTLEKLGGLEMTTSYWTRNLRAPVRFADAVEALWKEGASIFLEVSPHPVLVMAVEEMRQSLGARGLAVGSIRREQLERLSLLETLGAMHLQGQPLDPAKLFPDSSRRLSLPTYPWQRERHWLEELEATALSGVRTRAGGHPLLGLPTRLSTLEGGWLWDTAIGTGAMPWLADHRVQGAAIFPAAGYLEMMLGAAGQVLPGAELEVTEMELLQMLSLQAKPLVPVQVVARRESGDGGDVWRIHVATRVDETPDAAWTIHARGLVRRAGPRAPARVALASWQRGLDEAVGAEVLYGRMHEAGLEYGAAFRGIVEMHRGQGAALGKVVLPEPAGSPSAFWVHPALLDGAFQVIEAALAGGGRIETWMPVRIGSLRIDRRATGPLWCRATIGAPTGDASRHTADLDFLDETGAVVGEARGFVLQRLGADSSATDAHALDGAMLSLRWEPSPFASKPAATAGGRWLIVGDGAGIAEGLRARLESAGEAVVLQTSDEPTVDALRQKLAKAFGDRAPAGVVHVGSLEHAGVKDIIEAGLARGCDSVLQLVHAIGAAGWRESPRLYLVTRGAQAVGGEPVDFAQAPLLGLARVLATEHPELRTRRIDLDPTPSQDEIAALHAECISDDGEDEVAWRGAVRSAARLVRTPPGGSASPSRMEAPAGRPFALAIGRRGSLDGLELHGAARRSPGKGEVEIEVAAAGINFRDLLFTLGLLPDFLAEVGGKDAGGKGNAAAIGMECAGTIAAVGEGVTGLEVGDPVMAVAAQGAMASHLTVRAALVLPRPASLPQAQAASALIAPLTAWYSLHHVARLAKGERVLIHAAAGGVGLAAVQWALHVGAEVYATAGSPEKRAYLERMGVKYVSDSRSNRFVADVRAWTGGEGVDVVLNSLSGDLIEQSFGLLRSYGRFVEIGKRDYLENRALGTRPFLRNISFALVDLLALIVDRPDRVGEMLRELAQLLAAGIMVPPLVEAFPISRTQEAFRKMAQGGHIGKLALTLDDPDARVRVPAEPRVQIRRDASYLVTGGLGGLGLTVADWLARRGAGAAILVGRGGVTTPAQREAIARIEARGTSVIVASADVADEVAVARVLMKIPKDRPLRGVVHAAGLLDDGVIADLTPRRMRNTMAPKVRGGWNLHTLTRGSDLDFFVFYSSVAGVLGLPAQGNYAAANACLDALAHHRRAEGLPATSIDWGVFGEVGLAALQANRGRRLESRGMRNLTPEEGISGLERVLERDLTQVVLAPIDMKQWVEFLPAAAGSRMLASLLQESGAAKKEAQPALSREIAAVSKEKRLEAIVDVVRSDVARVLSLGRLGAVPADKPLRELGLDSLMAVELRNALGRRLGVSLPSTLTFDHPTPTAIAKFLLTTVPALSGQAGDGSPGTTPGASSQGASSAAASRGASSPAASPAASSQAASAPMGPASRTSNAVAPGAQKSATPTTSPAQGKREGDLALARAPIAAPAARRDDRIESIPMGERWFADGFRVIPTPGGFAQRSVDVTIAMNAVRILNEAGIAATLTHAMIRAAALALARNPELHQTVCGYRKLTPGQVDIGLSMAGKTSYAPVVVLAAADRVRLGDTVDTVQEAIMRGREKEAVDLANLKWVGWFTPIGFLRRLSVRVMQEMFWYRRKLVGTFQVSCVPTVDISVPLQFYSGSLLSFGRPQDTVVPVDGRPAIRPMLTLTVCVDHVASDSMRAAALVNEIIAVLESGELVEEARQSAARATTNGESSHVKALPAGPRQEASGTQQ
jgi:acyl transferase domain-containing protein/acyl carrier protein/NADP-dependent 3-hydroxy acid dehydrogenase YdfG